MSNENYVIRVADQSETSAIISFLDKYHTHQDVITGGLLANCKHKLSEKEIEEMEESMVEFVKNNPCLIAVHQPSNEIVGSLILVASKDPNLSTPDKIDKKPSAWIKLNESCMNIYKEINLYQKYPGVERGMNVRRLAVHGEHRGKGLATSLLKESVNWSKKNKFDIIYSFFTSPGAKKAATSAGFHKVIDYDLQTLRDLDGRLVFGDLGPNNITSVMAYLIKT